MFLIQYLMDLKIANLNIFCFITLLIFIVYISAVIKIAALKIPFLILDWLPHVVYQLLRIASQPEKEGKFSLLLDFNFIIYSLYI